MAVSPYTAIIRSSGTSVRQDPPEVAGPAEAPHVPPGQRSVADAVAGARPVVDRHATAADRGTAHGSAVDHVVDVPTRVPRGESGVAHLAQVAALADPLAGRDLQRTRHHVRGPEDVAQRAAAVGRTALGHDVVPVAVAPSRVGHPAVRRRLQQVPDVARVPVRGVVVDARVVAAAVAAGQVGAVGAVEHQAPPPRVRQVLVLRRSALAVRVDELVHELLQVLRHFVMDRDQFRRGGVDVGDAHAVLGLLDESPGHDRFRLAHHVGQHVGEDHVVRNESVLDGDLQRHLLVDQLFGRLLEVALRAVGGAGLREVARVAGTSGVLRVGQVEQRAFGGHAAGGAARGQRDAQERRDGDPERPLVQAAVEGTNARHGILRVSRRGSCHSRQNILTAVHELWLLLASPEQGRRGCFIAALVGWRAHGGVVVQAYSLQYVTERIRTCSWL